LIVDEKIEKLVNKAVGIMAKSNDILHDEGHIKRMLEDWNKLSAEIKEDVNCDAVVVAICWHDTWLASHDYKGFWGVIWKYIREGKGSAKMFRKAANEVGLDESLIDLVADAIKNHSSIPGNKQKTIEAKILWDVDNLETWSYPRLSKMIGKIGSTIDKSEAKQIRVAKTYWDLIMKKRVASRLYFDWCKKEFTKRKKDFVKKIKILEMRYGKLGIA